MANGATSVVDFLRRKGLQPQRGERFPFFDLRKRLFQQSGLQGELGDFRGTGTQNTALLNRLQKAETNTGVNISPDNINRILTADSTPTPPSQERSVPNTAEGNLFRPKGFAEVFTTTPGGKVRRFESPEEVNEFIGRPVNLETEVRSVAPDVVRELGGEFQTRVPRAEPSSTSARLTSPRPSPRVPTTTQGEEVSEPTGDGTPETTPEQDISKDSLPEGIKDLVSRAQSEEDISIDDVKDEALKSITESATFELEQEGTQAQKEGIRTQAQRKKEGTIRELARRGLIFSGIRGEAERRVEADKLADLLDVDRKFALMIATGLERAAQDLVKQAKKEIKEGRTEARDALESMGFALLPDGSIAPTLEAQRFQQQVRKEEGQAQRAELGLVAQFERIRQGDERIALQEAQNEFNQAKGLVDLQIAQEKLAISKARLGIAQSREARLASGSEGISTEDFREALAEDLSAINNAGSREEAINLIESNATRLGITYGQFAEQGLKTLANEIDRQYPAPRETKDDITTSEVGKQFIPALGETVTAPGRAAGEFSEAIGSEVGQFLRGVFGR